MKRLRPHGIRILLGLLLGAGPAPMTLADDGCTGEACSTGDETSFDAALEVWSYQSSLSARSDSVLNPGNMIARLPSSQQLLDARSNLQWKSGFTDVLLQPRLLAVRNSSTGMTGATDDEAYLSQGFIRSRPGQTLTITAGRFRFTWGPANFRSPSNPFYFDPGKNQPLRDVPGIDMLRVDKSLSGMQLTGAWVSGAGHLPSRPDIDSIAVLKIDSGGNDGIVSAIAAARSGGKPFVGAFGQYTATDALMLYGEIGHGQRPATLRLPAATHAGIAVVETPSPSATTAMFGASYTMRSGQMLSVEYLYDGHGYDHDTAARYYALAAVRAHDVLTSAVASVRGQSAAALGQMLAGGPALLGRHYAYLLWQSNPQESELYWRSSFASNLQDRSTQALLYAEKNLSRRISVFAAAMINIGSVRTEFGSVVSHSISLGAKVFVF